MAVSCLALTKNTATEIIGRPIVPPMPPRGPLALRNDDGAPRSASRRRSRRSASGAQRVDVELAGMQLACSIPVGTN